MKISNFIIGITGDCNFRCSYCYQRRTDRYLDSATAEKAVNFFSPYLAPDCNVVFYGGEPLLGLDRIKEIVRFFQAKNGRVKKRIGFSISSNGSLIDDDVLALFESNRFSVLLSFDGFAQELSKKKRSFLPTVAVLEKLLGRPEIDLETNSVFTAETVGYVAESIRFIVDLGVPSVNISFTNLPPWSATALSRLKEELGLLGEYMVPLSQKKRPVPVVNFRQTPRKKVFGCSAGKDRMFLSPDGFLWGCCLIYDYLHTRGKSHASSRYCFGGLDAFVRDHERIYPEVAENHTRFRMDRFFTSDRFCAQCEDLSDCVVCPVDTILGGSLVGKIPLWVCEIRKIEREARNRFLKRIGG